MMPAIKAHHTDTVDTAWDGPAAKANLKNGDTEAYYRKAFAWEDATGDGTKKSDFKFIHHEVSTEGAIGAANVTACRTGCAILNGSMGGADIPDADRKGVFNHLVGHLKDAGVADGDLPELKAAGTVMRNKHLTFDFKSLAEDGSFEGLLSTYGNIDQGGDVVERGAFAKTLQDNGAKVPMLWQHDEAQPIGMLELTDGKDGLQCKGTLALEVPKAREAYALMKRGIVRGLSIGYQTVRDSIESGVRHLKEIRLFEGSVVTFPMNMQAVINSVKALREKKDDFASELAEIQLYALAYQMMGALDCALCDIRWDAQSGADEKADASAESIDQFRAAYLEFLPQYLSMLSSDSMESMSLPKLEAKAGRMLSESSRGAIAQCIKDLQALLDAADAAEAGAKTVNPGTPEKSGAANNKSTAPADDHSGLVSQIDSLLEIFRGN